MAKVLKQPFMPWQRFVADVAFEVDVNGLPRYRQVIVTVPRQCGKSFFVLVLALHRMLMWATQPQQVSYSAQSITDSMNVWRRSLWPLITAAKLHTAAGLAFRRALGDGGIDAANGSGLRLLSSSPNSGHGATGALNILDEAMAFANSDREGAVMPTMRTFSDPQLWIVSTAGDQDSTYFRKKVLLGRELVASGEPSSTAFFEWGLHEDADWTDPTLWPSAVPALGYTVTMESLRAEYESATDASVFRRTVLNQWVTSANVGTVLPAEDWDRCVNAGVAIDLDVAGNDFVLGVDVAPLATRAAIVACGGGVCEVIESRAGASWVGERVRQLCARWPVASVVGLAGGGLQAQLEQLEAERLPVTLMSWGELAAGCGRLFDAVCDHAIAIRQHPDLEQAHLIASRKHRPNGSWGLVA